MSFKIIKISIIFIFFLIFTASGWAFVYSQAVDAQASQYELVGWLYSENYGWISLSSKNCEVIFNQDSLIFCAPRGVGGARVEYQVSINGDNKITGYGWSDAGWICFGSTCSGLDPDGLVPVATMDSNTRKIDGWANIMALGADGWIHFRRGGNAGSTVGQKCYDCEPTCLRLSQRCSMVGDPPVEVCEDVEPCLEYSEVDYDSCATCFNRTYFNSQNIPDSDVDSVTGGSGYTCSACQGNGVVGDDNEFCHESSSVLGSSKIYCSDCTNCELYGVNSDSTNGDLLGWGWNGDSTKTLGAGWIHFNSDWGAGVVYPWLETQHGAIFSRNDVKQKTGSVANNATYCIFADSVKGVSSSNCSQDGNSQKFIAGVDIAFPDSSFSDGVFYNALGKIDLVGITTSIYGIIINKNKFGHVVVPVSTIDSWSDGKILNNAVYVVEGDLIVDSDVVFNNGGIGQRGNGTIVVTGDLFINGNMSYEVNVPADLSQLASVAWIVEGDVVINPSVSNIVGAYVLLGNGEVCSGDDSDYPRYEQNGCGVFFSGQDNNPLTVSGLIVAKAFDFRRIYADIAKGSERIVYDGRLVANPSPGLLGFVEGLPIIRDFVY
jgi:hypothetical protein